MDCVCCRDTRRKGDSNPKIALLNALRENISDTDRKKGKRGQESVTKCSCVLVTSIDSHEVIVLC